MSFYYLNQNTNTGTSPFENFGFEKNFNIENFEGMPPINTTNTDNNYQCSDNVQITGSAIGSSIPNTSLANCKTQCKSESSCIGFDYDNSNSSCTLRNTVTDLTSAKQNNVMCVKKKSSACKSNSRINPQEASQQIIGNVEQGIAEAQATATTTSNMNMKKPMSYATTANMEMAQATATTTSNMEMAQATATTTSNMEMAQATATTTSNMGMAPATMSDKNSCRPDTIFVDLPCFLNKMDVLRNHSDNLMIDLQLLITNLKSCSYVKKPAKQQNSNTNNQSKATTDSSNDGWSFNNAESSTTVSNLNIPVAMPSQDTIKVYNTPASVLYTNNPNTNANVMLGVTEPFQSAEQQPTSFFESFTFKVIVIVCLLVLIVNMNK